MDEEFSKSMYIRGTMKSVVGLLICLTAGVVRAEEPVILHPGLGRWHHRISTRSPEAQKYFDQGLTLVYSFNRYEALRSFRKAAELDPSAAMAFWGISVAQGPYVNMDGDPSYNLKESCVALASGLQLASAPEAERDYLQVAFSWCPEYKPDAHVAAARALAVKYPDDPDAQTLYADSILTRSRWHWYALSGAPAPGVNEAEEVLQSVIRRFPQHPGANHLYIHSVESSPTPERGVASAQRLMGIVPGAGHMVHMPGHIWLVLGDWAMAATVNERAATVDREYFAATKGTGDSYYHYYLHNLSFIIYARSMQGRKAQALAAAKQLADLSGEMASMMPEMADAFSAFPIFAYVRFHEWDSLLKMPEPGEKMVATRATWSYARTLAFVGKGDTAAAAKEKAHFDELSKEIPASAQWGVNKAQEVMRLASEVLEAHLATNPSGAIAHWSQAVSIQDKLTYDEPPAWYYPVRESLGAALLRNRQYAEAAEVFREGVRRSPRNGRMLLGLHESLKAQGKRAAAETVKQEFEDAWRSADVTLGVEDRGH
jgi:tetratricopeptide (TPR) repeat protein